MFPIASPPAAPPPSPPQSDSDINSVQSSLSPVDPGSSCSSSNNNNNNNNNKSNTATSIHTPNNNNNYSDLRPSYPKFATSRNAASVPTITNYGLSPQQQFYASINNNNHHHPPPPPPHDNRIIYGDDDERKLLLLRGDVTLRPNTGNTNQETGAVFGSLREIVTTLRWMTIATTLTAIFWEGFALPMRIIATAWWEPSKVVLGAYLGIFCLLILGVEMNAPLRDNFGFLYNPITRGMVLLMMSSMCMGILKSWWESLLGIAFVVVGMGYVYTYIKYPEYRRWQDYFGNRQSPWQDLRQYWTNNSDRGSHADWERSSSIWANPDQGQSNWDIARHTTTSSSEARALLHNL
jgi:COPI associated protein